MSGTLFRTKRIEDLTAAAALADADKLVVQQADGTRRSTIGALLQSLFNPLRTAAASIADADQVPILQAGELRRGSAETIFRYVAAKGAGLLFATVAAATTANLAGVTQIAVAGHLAAGDGGAAPYVYTPSQPSHAAKFQAADGRWFQLASSHPSPRHFGAVGDLVTDDTAAMQAWAAYIAKPGRTGHLSYGVYGVRDKISFNGHVTVIGDGCGAQYFPQNDPVGIADIPTDGAGGYTRASGSWIVLQDGAAAERGWSSPTQHAIVEITYLNPNYAGGYVDQRRFARFENFGIHGNSYGNQSNQHAGLLLKAAWCVSLERMHIRDVTGYCFSTDQGSYSTINDLWMSHCWLAGGGRTTRVCVIETGDSILDTTHIWGHQQNTEAALYSYVGLIGIALRCWSAQRGAFFSSSADHGILAGCEFYGPLDGEGLVISGAPQPAGEDPVITATVTGGVVTGLTIVNGGTNLVGTLTAAFDDGSGFGSGASATFVVTGGTITGYTNLVGGQKYGQKADGSPTGYPVRVLVSPGDAEGFIISGCSFRGCGANTGRSNFMRAGIHFTGNPRRHVITGCGFDAGHGSFDSTMPYGIAVAGGRGDLTLGPCNFDPAITIAPVYIPSGVTVRTFSPTGSARTELPGGVLVGSVDANSLDITNARRLVAGATTPTVFTGLRTAALQSVGNGSEATLGLCSYVAATSGSFLELAKSYSPTPGVFAAPPDGSWIGTLSWAGADGAALVQAMGLDGIVSGTPAAGNVGALLRLRQRNAGGSIVETWRWERDGAVRVNAGANELITSGGLLRPIVYTLGTLPSAAANNGCLAGVSNGTGNKGLVRSDGTNWRYLDGTIAA